MNKDMIYHIFKEAPKSRNVGIIKIFKTTKSQSHNETKEQGNTATSPQGHRATKPRGRNVTKLQSLEDQGAFGSAGCAEHSNL